MTKIKRFREWLLAAQIAFCVMLLGAAGVVGAAFRHLHDMNAGLEYDHVLTLQLPPPARYAQPEAESLLKSS